MKSKELKLKIIQAVTECEDSDLLHTIHKLLTELTVDESTDFTQIAAHILGQPARAKGNQVEQDDDLKDIQNDINEVFGT